MSYLKTKSELSIAAAELLHRQNYYLSVPHCAYYSCFQLMKYIWLHPMGKTELELYALTRNSTEGSHDVLINQIERYMRGKALRLFRANIIQLKRVRMEADYQEARIDSRKSNDCIQLSKTISNELKKCI